MVVQSHRTADCHETTTGCISSLWWVPTGAAKQFHSSRLTFDTLNRWPLDCWQWKDSTAKTKKRLYQFFTTISARKLINFSWINFRNFQTWMWEKVKRPGLLDVFWMRKPMWLIKSEVDAAERLVIVLIRWSRAIRLSFNPMNSHDRDWQDWKQWLKEALNWLWWWTESLETPKQNQKSSVWTWLLQPLDKLKRRVAVVPSVNDTVSAMKDIGVDLTNDVNQEWRWAGCSFNEI